MHIEFIKMQKISGFTFKFQTKHKFMDSWDWRLILEALDLYSLVMGCQDWFPITINLLQSIIGRIGHSTLV